MSEVAEGIVGLAEAAAELDRLEAEAGGQAAGGQKTEAGSQTTDDSAGTQDASRAGEGADNAQGKSNDEAGGQKAEAGGQKPEDEAQKAGQEQAGKGEKDKGQGAESEPKSRFAKAQARLQGGWEELNAGKAAVKAEQDAWQKRRDAEKAELQREREEFEQQRTKAEGEFTPDQYDAAAKNFERQGRFDLADLAKGKAEQLRKNPPAKAGDRQEVARKDWALKAGKDFPELTKDNSPLQVRVAQLMNEEADFKSHPKGIYVAARIANLEAQASEGKALKVQLEAKGKELDAAKKEITELEQTAAPGGGNGTTRLPAQKGFEQMTPDEQLADLHRAAAELGSIR